MEDCDLVCFTDNKGLESHVFDVRVYPPIHWDPVRNARIFKVLPHLFFPDHGYSLWVDASVIFKKGNIPALVDNYLGEHNMALFAHPERDCIYDEAEACIALQKGDPVIIRKQMEEYRKANYPPHNGLVETTAILRRHLAADIIRFEEDWWTEIMRFSARDQLSFNFAAWKNKFRYAIIEGNVRNGDWFRTVPHKRSVPHKKRTVPLEDELSSLRTENERLRAEVAELNSSIALRFARKIPFGDSIRRFLVSRDRKA